jgi:hypothetical protein
MASLLDPAFGAFSALNDILARGLPAPLRVVLWSAIGAVVSLELYRVSTSQARLKALKGALKDAQEKVSRFDGEFADGWPLVKQMLKLALTRVGLILPATLVASLPLLALILWLGIAYGSFYPTPGSAVAVDAGSYSGRWVAADGADPSPHVEIAAPTGEVVSRAEVKAPVPVIAKRRWWNALYGNPAGYLPEDAPVDHVSIDLPRQVLLPFSSPWLNGWETVFLPSIFILALGYKRLRRIE